MSQFPRPRWAPRLSRHGRVGRRLLAYFHLLKQLSPVVLSFVFPDLPGVAVILSGLLEHRKRVAGVRRTSCRADQWRLALTKLQVDHRRVQSARTTRHHEKFSTKCARLGRNRRLPNQNPTSPDREPDEPVGGP